MTMIRATLMILAITIAMPVVAQTAPPTPAIPRTYSPAEKQLGVEIASLLNSRDDTVAMVQRAFGADLAATLATQPIFVQLEKNYPGIGQAMGAATGNEVKAVAVESLPELWDDLGSIYAETFDLGELQRLLTFYKSPAGKSLVRQTYNNMDTQALVKKGLENPTADLTASDLRTTVNPAAAKAALTLSQADRQPIMALMMSPIGGKLMTINPRLQAAAAAWANRSTAKYGPRIEAAVTRAALAYTERAKAPLGTPKK